MPGPEQWEPYSSLLSTEFDLAKMYMPFWVFLFTPRLPFVFELHAFVLGTPLQLVKCASQVEMKSQAHSRASTLG